jgi:hypothetical protein
MSFLIKRNGCFEMVSKPSHSGVPRKSLSDYSLRVDRSDILQRTMLKNRVPDRRKNSGDSWRILVYILSSMCARKLLEIEEGIP